MSKDCERGAVATLVLQRPSFLDVESLLEGMLMVRFRGKFSLLDGQKDLDSLPGSLGNDTRASDPMWESAVVLEWLI